MGALDAVQLTPLMDRTSGRAAIKVGLIDGPVFLTHPDLAQKNIQEVPGKLRGTCSRVQSAACLHGTFVAGMLCARRGSVAPAICPGCTLLVRPIFGGESGQRRHAAGGAVRPQFFFCGGDYCCNEWGYCIYRGHVLM